MSVHLMLIHMLFHITLAVTPGWCSKKMLFTLLFNVLSHALTQLLVTLSMSKWFYFSSSRVPFIFLFLSLCQITALILQHSFSWSPNFLQCLSNNLMYCD